jgi:hypothetical protein
MRRLLVSVTELAKAVVSLSTAVVELVTDFKDPMVRGPVVRIVVGQSIQGVRVAGKKAERVVEEARCYALGLTDWLGWTSPEDERWPN